MMRLTATRLIPINVSPSENVFKIRPIEVGSVVNKLLAHCNITPEAMVAARNLKDQVGMQPGGPGKLVIRLRYIYENMSCATRTGRVGAIVCTDSVNAFGRMAHSAILEGLENDEAYSQLIPAFTAMCQTQPLAVLPNPCDRQAAGCIEHTGGIAQGGVTSTLYYMVAASMVTEPIRCKHPGGDILSDVDDHITVSTDWREAITMAVELESGLASRTYAQSNRHKFVVVLPVTCDAEIPQECKTRCMELGLPPPTTSAKVLGGIVTNSLLESKQLAGQKNGELKPLLESLKRSTVSASVKLIMLQQSISKMGIGTYLLRCLGPAAIGQDALDDFDAMIRDAMLDALGITLQEWSDYRHLDTQLVLPTKLGGYGIRSAAHDAHVAYFAALAEVAGDLLMDAAKYGDADTHTRTEMEMQRAYYWMLEHGVAPDGVHVPDLSTLRPDETMWSKFLHFYAERTVRRLQKWLCKQIDRHKFQRMQNTLTEGGPEAKRVRDRIATIVNDPMQLQNTFMVLAELEDGTVVPTPDEAFTVAARVRGGLHPVPQHTLPPECACGVEHATHAMHTLACRVRGGARIQAHDSLARCVGRVAESAGVSMQTEGANDYQAIFTAHGKRPDRTLFCSNNRVLVLDFSITGMSTQTLATVVAAKKQEYAPAIDEIRELHRQAGDNVQVCFVACVVDRETLILNDDFKELIQTLAGEHKKNHGTPMDTTAVYRDIALLVFKSMGTAARMAQSQDWAHRVVRLRQSRERFERQRAINVAARRVERMRPARADADSRHRDDPPDSGGGTASPIPESANPALPAASTLPDTSPTASPLPSDHRSAGMGMLGRVPMAPGLPRPRETVRLPDLGPTILSPAMRRPDSRTSASIRMVTMPRTDGLVPAALAAAPLANAASTALTTAALRTVSWSAVASTAPAVAPADVAAAPVVHSGAWREVSYRGRQQPRRWAL